MSKKPISHNDDPAVQDAFGQEDFIARICTVIKACQPPKGIAINGYWGTGKTSALLQVYYQLSGKEPRQTGKKPTHTEVVPVWFEAWRYQNENLPIVALLNEIREQLGHWENLKSKAQKLSGVTLLGTFSAFDEAIKAASAGLFQPKTGGIQQFGEQWENRHYSNALPTQHIHCLLEEAVEKALGEAQRMVIFIDDLDRCTPAAALQLLEGIKVYLNLKNCVVLFGMDQRQIERALKKALDLDDSEKYADNQAREYLEKICQDVYHLPLPGQKAKSAYFIALLSQLQTGDKNSAHYQRSLQAVLERYDCLPANPRKIKALANRAGTVLTALDLGDGRDDLIVSESGADKNLHISRRYALMMALTVIYCFHRRLNEQLEKDPRYIEKVLVYAKHGTPKDLVGSDPIYTPFKGVEPTMGGDAALPANPSDSNVFRLHRLFRDFDKALGIRAEEVGFFYGHTP